MSFTFENEMKKLKNIMEEQTMSEKQKIYVLKYNEHSIDGMFITAWKKISVRAESLDKAISIGNKHFADNKNIKYREFVCDSSYIGFTEFYGELPVINVDQNGVNK